VADELSQVVNAPKLFLIGRKALADHPDRVREALRLTTLGGTFVTSDLDAHLATVVLPNVMGLHQPFAIVADVAFDICTIIEGGRVIPGELPEIMVHPEDDTTQNPR